jgi:Starch-binding associating with outer membrane
MKYNKIFLLIPVLIVMALFAPSCKKDKFNINKTPNAPTDSTIAFNVVLPAAQNATGRIIANNWGWLQNWVSYWSRSGTYAPNNTEETYNITTNFQAGIWTGLYDNLYDYQVVINGAQKQGGKFYEGIARIMKAHNYQMLVDVYNNVPYNNALKGNGNTTPSYDKGLDIYKDLFRQIDTAQQLIDASDPTIGADIKIADDDIIFGKLPLGNAHTPALQKTLWLKFGNTLKLRMLVHLFKVPGFDFTTERAKIAAQGSGYLGTGQTAFINPAYTSAKQNPFYDNYVADNTGTATANSVYFKANEWGIKYYTYNGDPRRNRFYSASPTGYRGVAYGLPPVTANAAATLSGIGPALTRTRTSGQWLLTSVESMFLQAEALNRGILTGGAAAAQAMYTNAVVESFLWTGLTATDASAYLTGNLTYPDVDYTVSSSQTGLGGGLYAIISQKWFALNGIAPFEVWTDYRRTNISYGSDPIVGYPAGPAISVAPSNIATKIPVRLLYPQNEYNYNPANVGAQGSIDQFSSKIFWAN